MSRYNSWNNFIRRGPVLHLLLLLLGALARASGSANALVPLVKAICHVSNIKYASEQLPWHVYISTGLSTTYVYVMCTYVYVYMCACIMRPSLLRQHTRYDTFEFILRVVRREFPPRLAYPRVRAHDIVYSINLYRVRCVRVEIL